MPGVSRGHVQRRLVAQFTDLFAVVLLVSSAITFLAYVLERPQRPRTRASSYCWSARAR
ncbi:hypothetical protein [Streptomyces roseochromogenus]|uniref:hypothetical protein n=1 Tax=Streptomyces roseochromogenus TaxID=285450 RepID=UPI001FD7DF30|nr:hypothetical protein [Streptomyces roseochromogenus]